MKKIASIYINLLPEKGLTREKVSRWGQNINKTSL